MDYQKKVSEIIEQALTEKTFNLEIIEKIKELRDCVIALEALSASNKIQISDLVKDKTEINNKLNEATKKLVDIEDRERKVSEQEKKQDRMQYELSFQQSRASEIKELFGLVFRNPVILKSKTVGHAVSQGNNYPTTVQTNDTESETIS